jgi:hypothetical protein
MVKTDRRIFVYVAQKSLPDTYVGVIMESEKSALLAQFTPRERARIYFK